LAAVAAGSTVAAAVGMRAAVAGITEGRDFFLDSGAKKEICA
jgi:hypothetical protein